MLARHGGLHKGGPSSSRQSQRPPCGQGLRECPAEGTAWAKVKKLEGSEAVCPAGFKIPVPEAQRGRRGGQRPTYSQEPPPRAAGTLRTSLRVWTEKAGPEVASSPRSLEATSSTSRSPAWRPPPPPRRAYGACTPTREGSWPSLPRRCPLLNPGLCPASALLPSLPPSVCLSERPLSSLRFVHCFSCYPPLPSDPSLCGGCPPPSLFPSPSRRPAPAPCLAAWGVGTKLNGLWFSLTLTPFGSVQFPPNYICKTVAQSWRAKSVCGLANRAEGCPRGGAGRAEGPTRHCSPLPCRALITEDPFYRAVPPSSHFATSS